MRRIHKIFLSGCGYAILILSLFYAFAATFKFISPEIAPKQFYLILTFALVIAIAEFMYEQLKVKTVYKCLIHYGVLFIAFLVIFVILGNISTQKASVIFIALIIYTFLYFVIWTIVHFVRKAINRMDDKLEAKTKSAKKTEKKNYKSVYSDGE